MSLKYWANCSTILRELKQTFSLIMIEPLKRAKENIYNKFIYNLQLESSRRFQTNPASNLFDDMFVCTFPIFRVFRWSATEPLFCQFLNLRQALVNAVTIRDFLSYFLVTLSIVELVKSSYWHLLLDDQHTFSDLRLLAWGP